MKVETKFLVHDSGSKFYETVLITDLSDNSMLIKRWGKIQEKTNGGQIKVHTGSRRIVSDEMAKILNEKTTYKSDRSKGKYDLQHGNFGLHPANGQSFDMDDMSIRVGGHYATRNAYQVETKFQAFFNYEKVGDQALLDEPMVKEIIPEPPRDGTWGSW